MPKILLLSKIKYIIKNPIHYPKLYHTIQNYIILSKNLFNIQNYILKLPKNNLTSKNTI